MLIISRKIGESLKIGDDITLTISDLRGGQVRIAIDAPKHVKVHREEIYNKIKESNQDK